MNCRKLLVVLALAIVMLASPCIARKKKHQAPTPDDSTIQMAKCIQSQLCDCGKIADYEKCWDLMIPVTHEYAYSEMRNKCGLDINTGTPFRQNMETICGLAEKQKLECFKSLMPIAFEYCQEHDGNTDPQSQEISVSTSKARKCFMPNVSQCMAFPGMCV